MNSPLGRMITSRPAPSAAELRQLRAEAWHEEGIAVLDPTEIKDLGNRAVVIQEAERAFGRRKG